jgi:hypothetical protein
MAATGTARCRHRIRRTGHLTITHLLTSTSPPEPPAERLLLNPADALARTNAEAAAERAEREQRASDALAVVNRQP